MLLRLSLYLGALKISFMSIVAMSCICFLLCFNTKVYSLITQMLIN
jgi:hypothetical protein